MNSSMNDRLLEAIQPSSNVERLFFEGLLAVGGDHPCIDPSELECQEISSSDKICRNPLVSISVITYNHEKYLRQTLDSLLAQKTDFEYEILIGEDCSTDHTRDIAFEYQKSNPERIRVLYSLHNVGATSNLRRTLVKARGKYYAFCEGDDFWCNTNKLQLQVDFLEQHPDFGLVHGNANKVDVNSNPIANAIQTDTYGAFESDQESLALDLLSGRRCIITCTSVFRRHILEELCSSYPLLFSTKMRLGDVQTWLGLASRSRVHYFPEVVASYRYSITSITSRGDPAKRLQFVADAFVVDVLCINFLLDAERTFRLTISRRLIGSIVNLSYANGKFSLLHASLAVDRVWKGGTISPAIAKGMLYLCIPSKWFSVIYRCRGKFVRYRLRGAKEVF